VGVIALIPDEVRDYPQEIALIPDEVRDYPQEIALNKRM
jgi:hypothetical protein